MLADERLELAEGVFFQLIDQQHKQTLVKQAIHAFRFHSVEKIQGLLYLWTTAERDFVALAHLLEFPEEEISTICFIPEQTQLQSDEYYEELQLANRCYTGAKRQLDEAIKHYRQALAKRTTIEGLNNIGCALLQSKRLKDAKSHFLSAISLAPNAHEPYHNLAHTQIKMAFSEGLAETELKEQTKESIELYEKSLKLNPENYFAWHNIGNIYAASEDYLQAIKYYLNALSLSPRYASSLCALAHCYRNNKQYSNAFEALLPLLKRNSSYSFLVTLANLIVESSNVKDLRLNGQCVAGFTEYFKNKAFFKLSVRQRLQLVKPLYEQALKLKPTSSSALTGLGNLQLMMGDYEQALQSFKKAVYFNSRCIAAHNGAALGFYSLRNYQLAEVKFNDSLKFSRSRLTTLIGTFVLKFKLKQTAQAAIIAEQLYRLYPQNQLTCHYSSLLLKDSASRRQKVNEGLAKKPLFTNNIHISFKIIGELMLEFGMAEEAVEYFKEAKDEGLLRLYQQQLTQPQKAIDAYTKLLQQNRNDDQALFRIAQVCFDYGLLHSCEAVLAELLKTDRENIKFLCLLGRVKSQQKRYGEEIAICQQIVSLTGEAEDALNCLALAHLKQGNLFEASRCVRLALKKDSRNWAVLNNLANISRQIEKHEEARHYYRESQQTGPECFVPFVNSAGLLPLYQTFPASESAMKTFNLCLHFLFRDQYNPCFSQIIKLAGKINDQDYFEMVNSIAILQVQFPPFAEYGLLLKFLLSSFCNKSPLLHLQRLLGLNESLDGFAGAIQSMNSYPCDQDTLSQILCLMLKQAFAVNQQEALLANHYLCEKHRQFQDYSKRKELILLVRGRAAARIEQLFKIIQSVLRKQEKQVTQSGFHKQINAEINKAKRLRTLIENQSIQTNQIQHALSQLFSIYGVKKGYFYAAFSDIFQKIEREQSKLINDLKQSSKEEKAKLFVSYYENSYFVNLFIKYSLHSFAHFIEPQKLHLLSQILTKCSKQGTIEILKMVMKELSIKESKSILNISFFKMSMQSEQMKKISQRSENQMTASSQNIQLQNKEKSQLSKHSEVQLVPRNKQLKETNYDRSTKDESYFSKLSLVLQSTPSERWAIQTVQKPQKLDHSALRTRIQFDLKYSSFNMCFCKSRQLCQQYLSRHSFLHFDAKETLMKTQSTLSYQQMLDVGYKEIFTFIEHLSEAILELEEHGIYHCDLSLRNVIKLNDTFKVVDFAFVLMVKEKDMPLFETTKQLVSLLFEPKIQQIHKKTVVSYIFRSSSQDAQSCLLELGSAQLDPNVKIDSFVAKLKGHSIAYNRMLLREVINGIVNKDQQKQKLLVDEISIITNYLNQITNQPHKLKQYLQIFRENSRDFMEQSSMLLLE